MNLKQLRHFAAIVEHGSFRKAAKAVHISQPALSLSIQRLEESLQVTLLDRTTTDVRPTVFGKALIQRAKHIETELRSAREELANLQGLTRGEVKIGISPYAATEALGSTMATFMADYPALDVQTIMGVYDSFYPMLTDTSLDFFISEIRDQVADSSIAHRVTHHLPYAIVAAPHHPLNGKKKLSVKDLVKYQWIYGTDWISNIPGWRSAFAKAGLEPPTPFAYGGTGDFYFGALKESEFLAVTPLLNVRHLLESGQLVSLKVNGINLASPIALVYRCMTTLSPAAQLLFDTIGESNQ